MSQTQRLFSQPTEEHRILQWKVKTKIAITSYLFIYFFYLTAMTCQICNILIGRHLNPTVRTLKWIYFSSGCAQNCNLEVGYYIWAQRCTYMCSVLIWLHWSNSFRRAWQLRLKLKLFFCDLLSKLFTSSWIVCNPDVTGLGGKLTSRSVTLKNACVCY